jgi:hypothetical protein
MLGWNNQPKRLNKSPQTDRNVITIGQRETDNINQMITISKQLMITPTDQTLWFNNYKNTNDYWRS